MTATVTFLESHFFIDQEHQWEALEALVAWARARQPVETGHWWYLEQELLKAQTLAEALEMTRWSLTEDGSANIIGIRYRTDLPFGSWTSAILEVVAPYVRPGSFIALLVETQEIRWDFDGLHARKTVQAW